jgi:hypothetical protein
MLVHHMRGRAHEPLGLDAYAFDAALRKALKLSERWLAMPPVELKSLVQEIVDRITVAADRIEIQLTGPVNRSRWCGPGRRGSWRRASKG